MSLRVVEAACQFSPDRGKGVIVIESDCDGPPFQESFTELEAQDTRHMAISYASTSGMGIAYINGNVIGPYPINCDGVSLEHVRGENGVPLPAQHPKMQPMRYRVDVPVTRPLR